MEDEGRSRKVWTLLEYLLINRRRDLSQDDLVELLVRDDRSANPANIIKNIVYRLRNLLDEYGLPSKQYILCKKSVYSWNTSVPCEVDVELFENKWKRAGQPTAGDEEKIQLYTEAIGLYRGRFLPRAAYEEWAVPYASFYHRIFSECVHKAYKLLKQREKYEQILSICTRATSIDPYDESFYEMLITAYIRLGRHKEALAAYETITGRLFNELGVNPSDGVISLYRDIMKTIKSVERDLLIIKDNLNEATLRQGAYSCNYEIFKDMYRFIARGVERTGQSVYVMLITLTDMDDELPQAEYIGEYMEKLHGVIAIHLRRGDLFARYSSTQYVSLLPGTSYENGCKIGERISLSFGKINRRKNYIKLHYKLQPLDPTDPRR
jgi:DNA-binding SARP family transcriptional activator